MRTAVRAVLVLLGIAAVSCRAKMSSPLPSETYGNGGWNIVNPSPLPLDQTVREVVGEYRRKDAAARAEMRASLRPIDTYTLRDFALRAAVFARRERDRTWLEDGATAYAMLNDPYDAEMFRYVLALLHHSAQRIGADSVPLFAEGASLARADVASVMRRFSRLDESSKSIDKFFMEELPTGIIYRGKHRYTPQHDLSRIMIDIAAILEDDRYEPAGIVIRTSLPETWVRGAEPTLRAARGGAQIDTPPDQALAVYVVEVADEHAAQNLLRAWRQTVSRGTARPSLGLARGNLFCLMISMDPAAMQETPQTLQRFARPIERVLDAALKTTGSPSNATVHSGR